jgi:DHA2 family multidrug resistance protein
MTAGSAVSAPEPPAITGGKLALLTLTIALATFMEVLDTSVANVAIPTIAGDLAVSPNQGTWVVSSYSVASAIAVPMTGWLARRFGEVRLFLLSVTLFTVMSVLCALATSLPMLVVGRLLQGLVSGPMVPLSQSILLSSWPPAKRGIALALWAMTIVVAPIVGPVMGGWITENLSWPWIFYINLPIGIISVTVNLVLLRGRETRTQKLPIDVVGLVLLVVGVGALQVMLDNGNDLDWFNSNLIVALACVATVALSFLIAWELTDPFPIVDLSLFAQRNFTVGTVVLFFGFMTFFASIVILPLWLQTVMGYTPFWAGLATAPVGILSLLLSPVIGRNLARLDLRILVSLAFLILGGVSLWNSGFNLAVGFSDLVWPRVIMGAGLACFFVPINSILLSGVPSDRIAAAAGLSSFLRTMGGAVGTALAVTIWNRRASFHHATIAENVTSFATPAQDYLNQLGNYGIRGEAAQRNLGLAIDGQSLMLATNDVFLLSALVFGVLMLLVWWARPPFAQAAGGVH